MSGLKPTGYWIDGYDTAQSQSQFASSSRIQTLSTNSLSYIFINGFDEADAHLISYEFLNISQCHIKIYLEGGLIFVFDMKENPPKNDCNHHYML